MKPQLTRLPLACATLAACLMFVYAPLSQAQLPVGGFLGPDPVEEQIEDDIEGQVGDSLEENIEEEAEEQIENAVEQFTEQNIQENIEDNIEEAIEQTVDASVEDKIDDDIAQSVDAAVTESLEDAVELAITDAIEDVVEDSTQETVAEAVEASVEDNLEESVVDAVEASVEESVAETIANAAESNVETSIEDAIVVAVEEAVAEGIDEVLAQNIDEGLDDAVETAVEASLEDEVEERATLAIEDRLENEIDEILDSLESDLEADENRIQKEQWLVMAEPAVFETLTSKGYLFDTVTDLPGLGLRLAEVAAPSTFDITKIRNGVLDVVGKDRAEVDLNHIYTAGAPEPVTGDGVFPRTAMFFPADLDDLDVRIGMIDSQVDMAHPALLHSKIQSRSFARPGTRAPQYHGTAIASIIAGSSAEYQGLAPSAEVYAASVFELDSEQGEIASTVSLLRALDWLLSSDVSVVNVSLAGPPNRLLERALERASGKGMVVMAAAGNGGPVARPMYPAAYTSVVAVTAVDSAHQVFRLANRGDYLALAAPGVDLRHAQSGGGFSASSGTSFAVPFAVTAAARLRRLTPEVDIVTALLQSALDLGPPGRDSIYGYGLLSLGGS